MGLVWGGVVTAPFLTLKQNNMARKLTNLEKLKILQQIKYGVHWTEIVKAFNTSTATIFKLKKDGEVKPHKPYPKRITADVPIRHIKGGDSFIYDSF